MVYIGRLRFNQLLKVGLLVTCFGWPPPPAQGQKQDSSETSAAQQTGIKSGGAGSAEGVAQRTVQQTGIKSGEAGSAEGVVQRTVSPALESQLSADDSPFPRFGYDIFNSMAPDTPRTLYGPVDPGYLIGPGDEIVVTVWGQVGFALTLTVSAEGTIYIPNAGLVSVNGLTLSALKATITHQLSKGYSGIGQQPPTTFVEVSLGKIQPIRVFIVGEVKRPGSYIIGPAATVLDALYQAGGPQEQGSLRDIRVFRQDKLVATVDLYDYLLRGNKGQDIRLQNDDTILIPPFGKAVSLLGAVFRRATYELREGEKLKDLIEISGGLQPNAYTQSLQITRIVANQARQLVDVDLDAILAGRRPDVELANGDIIVVRAIRDRLMNTVTLKGYVARPGVLQLDPGMSIKDLIVEADGLLGEAYLQRGDLIRVNPDETKRLISFRVDRAMAEDPRDNFLLQSMDEVVVYSTHSFQEEPVVTINGFVKKPGRYELLSNMTLKDLIVFAEGFQEGASRRQVEVARFEPGDDDLGNPVQIIQVNLDDANSADGKGGDFLLQHRDVVSVRADPNFAVQRKVTLSGEIQFPGVYALESATERLSNLIARAGGLKDSAYPEGIVFLRQHDEVGRIAVDLRHALRHRGTEDDPVLLDGDAIVIPYRPETVKVSGEVGFPASVVFKEGKGMPYYIERAGGYKFSADEGRVFIVLPNGEVKMSNRFLWKRSWPAIAAGSAIFVPAKGEESQGRHGEPSSPQPTTRQPGDMTGENR